MYFTLKGPAWRLHSSEITGVQAFCHTHREHRFFWLCRFLFLLQFHMQSMHQPHPCYLLKQSFWNPIWGQCRLNKISFWFGLPLRMGLLCLSRQNQQARKVCGALHGWWCVWRLRIASAPGSPTSCFSLSLSICSQAECSVPSTCRAERWLTLTNCWLFGICLIAPVAVCAPHPTPHCLCCY